MPIPTDTTAVVFDLDGTLIDSADDLGAAANRLLAAEERRPLSDAEVRQFIGDGSRVFVQRAWAATGATAPDGDLDGDLDGLVARFVAEYESDVAGHTRPYPGAIETVRRLKSAGLKIAVCTNKPQRPAEMVLERLGFAAHLDAVAGGDRFAYRKPDPRHLEETMRLLGATADRTVMVGDNEHDMAVAQGAGTGAVLVTYGYARTPLAEIDADARIDTLDRLPGLLRI
ncbi:MAG: phosphoglycolate phosphatase [Thalassobaculaceae bacterium]